MENDPFSLNNKNILVTGASSGIGRNIAIACSMMGATVIITGRNELKLKETYSLLKKGREHLYFTADLTIDSHRQSLIDNLPELDGVVQNAGVSNRVLCKNIDREDISNIFETNVIAPILLQKSLLEEKKIARGSSIIFMASMAALHPSIGNAIYSASKGSILSYAKVLALELAPRLIRVNCICPAMVWTDLITKDGFDKEVMLEAEKHYPLKRFGKTEDIANLCVYLLSNASSWMTGSNIEINGGGEGALI